MLNLVLPWPSLAEPLGVGEGPLLLVANIRQLHLHPTLYSLEAICIHMHEKGVGPWTAGTSAASAGPQQVGRQGQLV